MTYSIHKKKQHKNKKKTLYFNRKTEYYQHLHTHYYVTIILFPFVVNAPEVTFCWFQFSFLWIEFWVHFRFHFHVPISVFAARHMHVTVLTFNFVAPSCIKTGYEANHVTTS